MVILLALLGCGGGAPDTGQVLVVHAREYKAGQDATGRPLLPAPRHGARWVASEELALLLGRVGPVQLGAPRWHAHAWPEDAERHFAHPLDVTLNEQVIEQSEEAKRLHALLVPHGHALDTTPSHWVHAVEVPASHDLQDAMAALRAADLLPLAIDEHALRHPTVSFRLLTRIRGADEPRVREAERALEARKAELVEAMAARWPGAEPAGGAGGGMGPGPVQLLTREQRVSLPFGVDMAEVTTWLASEGAEVQWTDAPVARMLPVLSDEQDSARLDLPDGMTAQPW